MTTFILGKRMANKREIVEYLFDNFSRQPIKSIRFAMGEDPYTDIIEVFRVVQLPDRKYTYGVRFIRNRTGTRKYGPTPIIFGSEREAIKFILEFNLDDEENRQGNRPEKCHKKVYVEV